MTTLPHGVARRSGEPAEGRTEAIQRWPSRDDDAATVVMSSGGLQPGNLASTRSYWLPTSKSSFNCLGIIQFKLYGVECEAQ